MSCPIRQILTHPFVRTSTHMLNGGGLVCVQRHSIYHYVHAWNQLDWRTFAEHDIIA